MFCIKHWSIKFLFEFQGHFDNEDPDKGGDVDLSINRWILITFLSISLSHTINFIALLFLYKSKKKKKIMQN